MLPDVMAILTFFRGSVADKAVLEDTAPDVSVKKASDTGNYEGEIFCP